MTEGDAVAAERGGRPRKYPSESKRPTLTFRVRGGLYEKLRTSAAERELSISEEIESRLEASFDRERRAGSRSTQLLMDALASELSIREIQAGKAWTEGSEPARYYFERLKLALAHLMDVIPAEQIKDEKLRNRAELFEIIARTHESALEQERGMSPSYDSGTDPAYLKRYGGGVLERILSMADGAAEVQVSGDVAAIVQQEKPASKAPSRKKG